MAYAKTHRVPWAPSTPGRPRVDEVVTRPRFGLRFSVCDQDGTEHRESDRNGNLSLGPVRDACSLRRGTEGPPEPSRGQRRSWRGRRTFCDSCGQEKLCYAGQALHASSIHPCHGLSLRSRRQRDRPNLGYARGTVPLRHRGTPNRVRRRP